MNFMDYPKVWFLSKFLNCSESGDEERLALGRMIKAAAKLFRVGMLMYGKTASVAEMWKWMRY